MVVVAIVAIVGAIVIPNMVGWRESRKLRGAVNNLASDLQLARMTAIRDADTVAVLFNTGSSSGYSIFVDTDGDWTEDATEKSLRKVSMPAGIQLKSTTFSSNRVNFDTKGLPQSSGTVQFQGSSGKTLSVEMNSVGRIQVKES